MGNDCKMFELLFLHGDKIEDATLDCEAEQPQAHKIILWTCS